MKETIICKQCGKGFPGYPSEHRVYCSPKCDYISRGGKRVPKTEMVCSGCGKRFMEYPNRRKKRRVYCTRECCIAYRSPSRLVNGTGSQDVRKAWKAYNMMPFDPDIIAVKNNRLANIPHAACYLKEARAILEGKDTKFRNRCTKLPGDEEPA